MNRSFLGARWVTLLIAAIGALLLAAGGCCPRKHAMWNGGYGLRNGSPFFKAEPGEIAVDAMVYQRGSPCEVMFAYKGSAAAVRVTVVDSRDRPATTLELSRFGGTWRGQWKHWRSSLWDDTAQIPVGRYTAVFDVTASGASSTAEQLPFYVIFDDREVEADLCHAPVETALGAADDFWKWETAVWFASGHNSDRAMPYLLHSDDHRIFRIALGLVHGQTDSFTAAERLSDWVAARFGSDLSYHTNDALDLLENHTTAQCVDEAALLVALLRAVGVPAHTVTADAAWEVGGYGWSFETWVQARLKGTGKPEAWYVLNPHDYPDLPPIGRSSFGQQGLANKQADDVIIQADCNWTARPAQASDGGSDVAFSRNSCREPDQSFVLKADWVSCQCAAYWGTGHWTCSPPRQPAIRIAPERQIVRSGDPLSFRTVVTATKDLQELLTIRVVADDIRSARWPDRVIAELERELKLAKGKQQEFDDVVRIPPDLLTTDRVLIAASIGREDRDYFEVQPVRVKPRFEWKLAVTEPKPQQPRRTVVLVLLNPEDESLHDVTVRLRLPFGLKLEHPQRMLGRLALGESREVRWELPLDLPPGLVPISLTVESSNGGGVRIDRNIGRG